MNRVRTADRRVFVGVGAATVLLYTVLAVWACVTPPLRAPDEPQHISTILRLAYSHAYPAAGTAQIYPAVKGAEPVVGFHIVGDFLDTSPEHAAPAGERGPQTLRELAGQAGPLTLKDFDQMTQHPPGYYALMAVPTRLFNLIDATPRNAIFTMRLLSALFLLPLPFLAFRLATLLGGSRAVGLSAAFLPAALPQFTHVASAVNNDALIIPLAAALVVQAVAIVQRGVSTKRAVWFGVTYAAALLTKGMALPLGILVIGGYVLAARRQGLRAVVRPALVTGLISCVGLAWWVANIVRFGSLQPDGYPPAWLKHLPHGNVTFTAWFSGFFDTMAKSFWLDLGWLEMSPPRWGYVAACVALIALLAIAIVRAGRNRGALVLAQLGWIAVLASIFEQSHAEFVVRSTVAGSQGRYLFTGLAAMAAAVALAVRPPERRERPERPGPPGRQHARRRRRRVGVAPWIPVVAIAAALFGLARGVHHFYLAPTWWDRAHVMSTWSPLRLRELALLLAVAAMAAIVGVFAIWRAGAGAAESNAGPEPVNSELHRVETLTTAEDGNAGV